MIAKPLTFRKISEVSLKKKKKKKIDESSFTQL
jgi:hypothetical protein